MTNTLSVVLGLLIILLLLADVILTGGNNLLFLARKFAEFTEWMAFWR